MRYHLRSIVESMIDHVFYRSRRTRPLNVMSTTPKIFLGVWANAICGPLSAGEPLIRTGLVTVHNDGNIGFVTPPVTQLGGESANALTSKRDQSAGTSQPLSSYILRYP